MDTHLRGLEKRGLPRTGSPNAASRSLTDELSFTEGDPLFVDLKGPDGATNRGVARPLFGRTWRASLQYRF
ncbi:MAG: hypothetical protein P8Y45_14395 [Exilibacterium sp.]